jgi:hypothetical protein
VVLGPYAASTASADAAGWLAGRLDAGDSTAPWFRELALSLDGREVELREVLRWGRKHGTQIDLQHFDSSLKMGWLPHELVKLWAYQRRQEGKPSHPNLIVPRSCQWAAMRGGTDRSAGGTSATS